MRKPGKVRETGMIGFLVSLRSSGGKSWEGWRVIGLVWRKRGRRECDIFVIAHVASPCWRHTVTMASRTSVFRYRGFAPMMPVLDAAKR